MLNDSCNKGAITLSRKNTKFIRQQLDMKNYDDSTRTAGASMNGNFSSKCKTNKSLEEKIKSRENEKTQLMTGKVVIT